MKNTTQGEYKEVLQVIKEKTKLTEADIKSITATEKLGGKVTMRLSEGKKLTLNEVRENLITYNFIPFQKFELNGLVGSGASGKTQTSIITMIRYVLSEKYQGRNSKAIIISMEDSWYKVSSRFKLICQLMKISEEDIAYADEHIEVRDMKMKLLKFFNKERELTEDYSLFLDLIAPFDLVVIDHIGRLMSISGLKENMNEDANLMMSSLAPLCSSLKKTIILLGHSAKGTENFRGAEAFRDNVRHLVFVSQYLVPVMKPKVLKDGSLGDLELVKNNKGDVVYTEDLTKLHLRRVSIEKDNTGINDFMKATQYAFDLCYENVYKIFDVKVNLDETEKVQDEDVLTALDNEFRTDEDQSKLDDYITFSGQEDMWGAA